MPAVQDLGLAEGMKHTDFETPDSPEAVGAMQALQQLGYECNAKLAVILWRRFSNYQAASWLIWEPWSVDLFIGWIESGMKRDEAWS